MNSDKPTKIVNELHLKATAALNKEVASELEQEDRNLKALLDEKDNSEAPSDNSGSSIQE